MTTRTTKETTPMNPLTRLAIHIAERLHHTTDADLTAAGYTVHTTPDGHRTVRRPDMPAIAAAHRARIAANPDPIDRLYLDRAVRARLAAETATAHRHGCRMNGGTDEQPQQCGLSPALQSTTCPGWPVFLLGRNKRPVANCAACRDAGPGHDPAGCGHLTCHGFYAATLDPGRYAAMAELVPDGMLAIRTGAASGLVVVDIDPAHDGTIAAHLMPPTAYVRTGSGGWHLYYAHPGGTVRCSQSLDRARCRHPRRWRLRRGSAIDPPQDGPPVRVGRPGRRSVRCPPA